jgi:K(+)-stimulated pyrophosphate-energized sodium pump
VSLFFWVLFVYGQGRAASLHDAIQPLIGWPSAPR